MVLATRLGIVISVFSLVLAGGCQSQTELHSKHFKMGGNSISITSDETHCYLSIQKDGKTEAKTTLLSPPCALTMKNDDDILTYPYPAKSIEAVAIIVGNPISEETRKEWGIDDETLCGKKIQGVLLKGNSITLTDWAMEGGVSCPSLGLDEKVFYGFAHPETHKP